MGGDTEQTTAAAPPPRKTHFNGPWYLKLLVANNVAGSIIGRNGTVIASIEQQTGCTLRLSPSNFFFPGTNERIVGISGEPEEVTQCLGVILDKVKEASVIETPGQAAGKITVKLIAPNSAVSPIIGRQGQTIKHLQETTGAKIQISNREDGVDERTITVHGSMPVVVQSLGTLVKELQADASLKDHMNMVYSTQGQPGQQQQPTFQNPHAHLIHGHASQGGHPQAHWAGSNAAYSAQAQAQAAQAQAQYGGWNLMRTGGGAQHPQQQQHPHHHHHQAYAAAQGVAAHSQAGAGYMSAQQQQSSGAQVAALNSASALLASNPDILLYNCEIYLHVPDSVVGALIGKSGKNLEEIQRASNARVRISLKTEIIPGTSDRRITISGPLMAVHTAHVMILARYAEAQPDIKVNLGYGAPEQAALAAQHQATAVAGVAAAGAAASASPADASSSGSAAAPYVVPSQQFPATTSPSVAAAHAVPLFFPSAVVAATTLPTTGGGSMKNEY